MKEPFFLDKITEHQSVQHHRSIPLLIAVLFHRYMVVYSRYEIGKSLVFLLKTGIEVFGYLLRINRKSSLNAFFHIDNRCRFSQIE